MGELDDAHLSREEVAEALWPTDAAPPTHDVRCRHCAGRSRVEVAEAVLDPEMHDCGHCGGALFLAADEPLRGLPAAAYEHPLDRDSLAALRALPGFPALTRWLLEQLGDRSARLQLMADCVRCGPDQFPELAELAERARRSLDVPLRPTVYLGESPHVNAMTTGTKDAVVVVQSAMLDQLDDRELVAVLGHELGHLHAGHPMYKTLARLVLAGGSLASGLVRLLSWPIQKALARWDRCSELTADRAGLLASRDLPACLGVLVTMAGGNRPGTTSRTRIALAPFVRQARELRDARAASWLDDAVATWLTLGRSHPHVAWRLLHLVEWVEEGGYLDLIAGDHAGRT